MNEIIIINKTTPAKLEYIKRWKKENREKVRAYQRKYDQNEYQKERKKEYMKEYMKTYIKSYRSFKKCADEFRAIEI